MISSSIVESNENVIFLGGGSIYAGDLDLAMSHASAIICADGGANYAAENGLDVKAVVGDMDSISDAARRHYKDKLYPVADQNCTDFDKTAELIQAPLILGLGFLGGRLDHQLSVFSGLAKARSRPIILLGETDICFRCPAQLRLSVPAGTRLSLYPVTAAQAQSTGLEWPVNGLDLRPDGRLGTSNKVACGNVSVDVTQGDLLVILPKQHLTAAIQAVSLV